MSWTDGIEPGFGNSIHTSGSMYTKINTLYNEIIDLSEGDYNIFRLSPDGDRLWTNYWLTQNPGGVSQLDTTTSLYDEVEVEVNYATTILADNDPSLDIFLGQGETEDNIQLMAKGEYLLGRIELWDFWDLDSTSFPRYFTFTDLTTIWPNMTQSQFDQMDYDFNGDVDELDLIAFLNVPVVADRGMGTYTENDDPTLCLRRIYLELKELRDNLIAIKWRSKLQSYQL